MREIRFPRVMHSRCDWILSLSLSISYETIGFRHRHQSALALILKYIEKMDMDE